MTAIGIRAPRRRHIWDAADNRVAAGQASVNTENSAANAIEIAEWQAVLLMRLLSFGNLRPGWDGHYAPTPSDDAIVTLANFLLAIPMSSHPGAVVPTAAGGAQLEWHAAGWDIEVAAEPDGELNAWICNDADHIDEAYGPSPDDVSRPVHRALQKLTANAG